MTQISPNMKLNQKTVTRTFALVNSYAKAERITVKYGFDVPFAEKHNRAPYFSITCDIHEQAKNNRWIEAGGGASHELIAKRFPSLAPLVRWHLVSVGGSPRHYVADACYWTEKALGVSKWDRSLGEPDPVQAFNNTVAFGSVDGDTDILQALIEEFGTGYESEGVKKLIRAEIKQRITEWCVDRATKLNQAFMRDMIAAGVMEVSDWVSEDLAATL